MEDVCHIAVVGSGYVGLVAAICFAEIGHRVICVDNDEGKVAALRSGDSLIHEKHLPELLERYRNTRVKFTTDLAEATRECDAIFIADLRPVERDSLGIPLRPMGFLADAALAAVERWHDNAALFARLAARPRP